jgi:hypothetical protein
VKFKRVNQLIITSFSVLWIAVPQAQSDSTASGSVAGIKYASKQSTLNTPPPTEWKRSKGRECIRKGRYRNFCQGPRRVPRPHGPEALLAKKLGLGDFKTVNHLMLNAPKPEWVRAAGPPSGNTKLLWPVSEGKLWRGFNQARRKAPRKRKHLGIDIGAPEGTLFRAVDNGLVVYSDNEVRGYGNLLVIVHPDGSVTFYAHAKALYLFPGQKVKRGQVLGEVGHTGIARGSHLHFEYRVRGRARNPMRRFDKVILPKHRRIESYLR